MKLASKLLKIKLHHLLNRLNLTLYGKGCSYEGELVQLGVAHNFIEKSGSWYSYGGQKIGQGKENVKTFLKENPEIVAELDELIRAQCLPEKDTTTSLTQALRLQRLPRLKSESGCLKKLFKQAKIMLYTFWLCESIAKSSLKR